MPFFLYFAPKPVKPLGTAMAKVETKDILARLDIRNFYQGELPDLRGSGDEMNANCPFHDDHGQHFYANVETGLFNCQRCDAKGDVFKFFQDRHGMTRQ